MVLLSFQRSNWLGALLLIFLLFPLSVEAQLTVQVVSGEKVYHTFRMDTAVRPLTLSRQQAIDSATRWFVNQGFLYASITQDSLTPDGLILQVVPKQHFVLGKLRISGVRTLTEEAAVDAIGIREGDQFSAKRLEQGIDALLLLSQSKGYALAAARIASIVPRVIDATSGALDITIDVREGLRVTISGVELVGNELTEGNVIYRQLQLADKLPYDKLAVEKIRSRLSRMGFFESVSEPTLVLISDSTVHLNFVVKEASTSRIEGVLGYSPARGAELSGFFSGFLHLAFRNISGTARNASLAFDKESRETQQIKAEYFEPWILGLPVSIGVGFVQRQQDTSYVQLGVRAEFAFSFADDITFTGVAGYERTTPTETVGSPFSAFNSRSLTLGARGTYDSRNDIFSASRGILLEAEASTLSKSIYGPKRFLDPTSDIRPVFAKFLLHTEGYFAITERLIAATRLRAATLRGPTSGIESSDLFRLGGFQTIRGYREREFLTDRFAYLNQEFRLLTASRSFLFSFFDAAFISGWEYQSRSAEQGFVRLSYGVGIQFATPVGLLSASVGVPTQGSFDQAKIHFGILEVF